MPWWTPQTHADRRPLLVKRGAIKASIREYFQAQGFTEVECSVLVVSPGNETHLHAFQTSLITPDAQSTPLYLHTSPEFAAKKLLAAGEKKIFEFARVFRNRERGRLHAPEFTMLEWYRAHDDYRSVIHDSLKIMALAADVAAVDTLYYRGARCDPHAEADWLTVAHAFGEWAGIDLLDTISLQGIGQAEALRRQARHAGIAVSDDDDWSDIFSKILTSRIEPNLGMGRPCVLYQYPICEAALARATPDDPRLAERFELYACGIELANGFGELTDPGVLRVRFEQEMTKKEKIYGERYRLDEEFLASMTMMPQASGVAMGFDRLVMAVTGAPNIDSVLWTPLA